MRALTCIGDATRRETWSGTPYHFLKAGMRASFLHRGMPLKPERLSALRIAWNIQRAVRFGEYGGFQYSRLFAQRLQTQARSFAGCSEIISHFPLFPPIGTHDVKTSFYIDATLLQNFEAYGLTRLGVLGPKMRDYALCEERKQYSAAERIICMSQWAARSVIDDYGVDANKVHVVAGGANLDLEARDSNTTISSMLRMTPLRLGFIGKDWRRKNLPCVLAIADVLHARGIRTEVVAAGFDPCGGPRHPLLRCVGYIDKASNSQRFVEFIRGCHFMCLFSSAEAFGISNRESLYLGVPVLARNVGGIADTVPSDGGHLFDTEASAEDIADVVARYAREPERYLALRRRLAELSFTFTWDASVQKIVEIWAGSVGYSCAIERAVHE